MVATVTSRLDFCVEANFDFTHSDEIVLTLIEIIAFTIKLESTNYLLIFNDKYYNYNDFGQFRTFE